MAAAVTSALVLGACGGSDDDTSADTAADVTVADDGQATATSAAAGDGGTDGGTDDGTDVVDTLVVDDGSSADADTAVTGNPALFALTELPTDEVCAMIPPADAEAIVGVTLGEPSGMQAAGLGTNCIYNDPETFDMLAKLEFSVLPWSAVVGLASFKPDGVPATEECEVAGRSALCAPEYEADGFFTGAQVYVQLGGDEDIALFTESSKGVEAATRLAELALSNLTI